MSCTRLLKQVEAGIAHGCELCHYRAMTHLLKADEIVRQLTDLPAWAYLGDTLHRDVEAPEFLEAIRIVDEVAVIAEQMEHHPDIDIRWRKLTFALSTHSAKGVTQLDIELAHRIEEIAAEHGAR